MPNHSDDESFEQVGAGASLSIPKQCSALRKNEYVLLKGNPCKIVEMSTSKTGKHGHAKVHLTGICCLSGKKYEDICPSTHSMEVPHVSRTEYMCIGLDESDHCLSLMDESGGQRDDLFLKPEVPGYDGLSLKDAQEAVNDGQEVLCKVLKTMGNEVVVSCIRSTKNN